MYETVKNVNGYEITRLKGSRKAYHVRLDEKRFLTFRTVKEATEYIQGMA